MTIVSERSDRRTVVASPSRSLRYLPATALAVDAGLLAVAALVAVLGRKYLDFFSTSADLSANVGPAAPFIAVGWLGMLYVVDAYRPDVFGAGADEFKRVLNGSMYAAAAIGVGCYLTKTLLSRGFFVLLFVVGVPALLAGRAGLRVLLHRARRRGSLLQRVVIVGGPAHVDEIAAVLHRETQLGYEVVGALIPGGRTGQRTGSGIPVLGDASDPRAVGAVEGLDVLFFTGGSDRKASDLREIVWELEQRSIQLVMAPSITDMSSERVRIRPVGGLPLIHMEAPRWVYASRWAKRTFDVLVTSALVAVLLPVFAVIALRVKLHDGGPVLFRQIRVGRGGAEFPCLKFRTMVVDAEEWLPDLHEEVGHVEGLFKMKDDPRITKPGRWLRRFSLDELPQLLNVLRGEMSLVGPRPPLPAEVENYDTGTERRLHVRPGVTGLWQVSGRSDLSWDEAVRLDLYYIDNWSMLQDVSILARTVGAVLSSRGAY
ncbi:MAG TPA: sugar transferase [Nocardioides sp.]|uniref:sugar transferase n=1 Tax=Nocardioides sp. TaxID=35761 RepID=UPI002ED96EF6